MPTWSVCGAACSNCKYYGSTPLEACLNYLNYQNTHTSYYVWELGTIEKTRQGYTCGYTTYVMPGHHSATGGARCMMGWMPPSCPANYTMHPSVGSCEPRTRIDKEKEIGRSNCEVGNPVDLGSGNKFQEEIDYKSSSRFGLEFVRYYNSSDGRWRNNFERYLKLEKTDIEMSKKVLLTLEDGKRYIFFGRYNEPWTTDPDVRVKLSSEYSASWPYDIKNFKVTREDNTIEEYDTKGKLISISEMSGLKKELIYDTNNRLIKIRGAHNEEMTLNYNTSDQLISITVPGNKVYGYEYDSRGNITEVIYPDTTPDQRDNPRKTYLYEDERDNHRLTGIIDENGNRYATYRYDDKGRTLLSEHADGTDRIEIEYIDDETRKVTNALGKVSTYKFEKVFGIRKPVEVTGEATGFCESSNQRYAYNDQGQLKEVTDWKGNKTQYEYNNRFLETKRIEATGTPESKTTTTDWHATYNLPTKITRANLTTELKYDTNGNLTNIIKTDTTKNITPYSTTGQKRETTFTYDTRGNIKTIDGPRTDVQDITTFTYDPQDNPNTITNALNHKIELTNYTPDGRPQNIKDQNNIVTGLKYDQVGRLIEKRIKAIKGDILTIFKYNNAGEIIEEILPTNLKRSLRYDNAHRLVEITQSDGIKIEYQLNKLNNITNIKYISKTGEVTYQRNNQYDELGRLLKEIRGNNSTREYAYDTNSNLINYKDSRGNSTTYRYDPLNRLILEINPLNVRRTYQYNQTDYQRKITDPNGVTTQFIRDGFNNIIEENSPDIGRRVYKYDTGGNPIAIDKTTQKFDALNRMIESTVNSRTTRYIYDENRPNAYNIGRLTGVRWDEGNIQYDYDEQGNIISERRDIEGIESKETRYSYNVENRLISIRYPSRMMIVYYTRDTAGNITQVDLEREGAKRTLIDSIEYLPYGPAKTINYADNLKITRGYDKDYNLIRQISTGENPISDIEYQRDPNNNINTSTEAIEERVGEQFEYDSINRLTLSRGSYGIMTYTYDPNGNRLNYQRESRYSRERHSYQYSGNRMTTLDINGSNKNVQKRYEYDGRGNIAKIISDPMTGISPQIMQFEYNESNQPIAVKANDEQVVRYSYAPTNERVTKETKDGKTYYQYDLNKNILSLYKDDKLDTEYIYLNDQKIAYIKDNRINKIIPNQIGTTYMILDQENKMIWRNNLEPFGNQVIERRQEELLADRLPGQYKDTETNLYYNLNRIYDPEIGRYIQADPIGLIGGLNRYAYVDGNPVNYGDPWGLILWYADKGSESAMKPHVRQIMKTPKGRQLLNQLHSDPQTYLIHSGFDDEGYTNYRNKNYVYVNPYSNTDIQTDCGTKPASITRILAHELGHLTGINDDGLNQMNNINEWENPIMYPLEGYNRTKY